MEPISLPLARGGALELPDEVPRTPPLWRRQHPSSAHSLSPRTVTKQQQQLMRRVSSYQHGGALQRTLELSRSDVSESSRLLFRQESERVRLLRELDAAGGADLGGNTRWRERVLEVLVNVTSGVIAFLLASTLTVSCASVVVGHATPLATVIAKFIDMNLLGTALLSLVLAWQSEAPWTLGAIDVFVYVWL